ncbi:MAG: hypothetical protein L0H79_05465 [Intrasporangium sp.]|uniref:hypothetical protein n=1 Tax=Intrasporangium sp. TaxID=1925024 RepID=UPI002648CEDD|nr:hypothetical protein [Intrasporangium sp.]MDN5795185.1 hypothetical protein [Intrasporangium sp.]
MRKFYSEIPTGVKPLDVETAYPGVQLGDLLLDGDGNARPLARTVAQSGPLDA